MNANSFSLKLIILAFLFKTTMSFGQVNPLGMDNTFIGLDRENGVLIMSGVALASYFLVKKASEDYRIDYYQAHIAYFNGDGYDVYMQNFGLEREYSSWFSLRVEGNIQEFNKDNFSTFGMGLKLYSRYTLFGKKSLSPFFEYGAGVFNAFKKFPEDGSTFTFNITYALGLEYNFTNKNKIRIDYNFIHHSNGNLSDSNPGFDGNGISFSYSWFWK
ncbi:acyloxyacyl hydrolase [bacterium AH-315-P13]|nr:acyloxyacyl hydrolase [bacterium AH-315-P13]